MRARTSSRRRPLITQMRNLRFLTRSSSAWRAELSIHASSGLGRRRARVPSKSRNSATKGAASRRAATWLQYWNRWRIPGSPPSYGGADQRRTTQGGGPNFTEIANQASGPAVDIALADVSPHALHANPPLLGRHFESAMNGVGQLLCVVRVDDQRVGELVAGARKTAQNQDALIVGTRGDKFFRHQVHAVVQRSHQAEVGCTVVRQDFLVAVLAGQQDDRLPVTGLKTLIDPVGFASHLLDQIVIARNVSPAGRADLHESEFLFVSRAFFQEALNTAETFRNSLGVVDAIHSDAHEGSAHAEFRQQRRALQMGKIRPAGGFGGVFRFGVQSHANGKRPDQGLVAAARNAESTPVNSGFQCVIHGVEEIIAVGLDMEANQVRSEQAVQQFALPRTDSESL